MSNYDSRFIVRLSQKDYFKERMPGTLNRIANMEPLSEDLVASERRALNNMKELAQSTLREGPNRITSKLYGGWARENGFVTQSDGEERIKGSGISIELPKGCPIRIERLTEKQRELWEMFLLNSAEVGRDSAPEYITLIDYYLTRLPDLRRIFGEKGFAKGVRDLMLIARLEIGLLILPDMTDAEARKSYGGKATGELVRNLDINAIFNLDPENVAMTETVGKFISSLSSV